MTKRTWILAGLLFGLALVAVAAVFIADLGFRVDPDGFSFDNYGAKTPAGTAVTNITDTEMALLFGETAVYKTTAQGKVLTTPAANTMKKLNAEMNDGHCEGMAVLSLLFYADTISPATYGASTTYGLDIEDNAPLQRAIARWFATQYTSPTSESESFVTPTNFVRALIAQLGLGKKSNPLYTVGIYKRNNGGGGHAMTPYAVSYDTGNHYYIYVYDNNYPNSETRKIAVDTGTDTWFYYASINPDEASQLYDGDSTSENLSLAPMAPRLKQQKANFEGTAPFAKAAGSGSSRNGLPIPASTWGGSGLEATALEMTNGDDTHTVALIINDHADSIDFWVADTQGRFLGRMNNALVNQIPNARILRSKGGGAPQLVVPAGLSFTVTVSGARLTDTATVSLSCAGEGTDLEISELELEPNRVDTVFFSPAGNRLCYVMGGEAVASLILCFHGAEEDFAFEAANIEAETGTRLEFAVEFDEERLRIANQSATSPAILDLAIQRIDEEDEDYFENDDFVLPADDTGYLEFGEWAGEGDTMAFLIDDGDGTADTIYSMNDEHRNGEMPVSRAVTPSDTHPSVNAPVAATDTFLQINFRHGVVVAGTLVQHSNATGLGASYQETTALVNAGDTLLIPVWTNQTSMMLFLGIRSDSASLDGGALPTGIPNTDAGRRAFAATTILVEFGDSWGRVLGDTRSTTNIGDTFAYTLIYQLSETTVRYYRALGFDTSPGSNSFRYYYADTYGGAWKQLNTCTVTVAAGASAGSLVITVTGITIDLPGGLGGVSSATAARTAHGCLLTRAGWLPDGVLAFCRWLRDVLLASDLGRLCVQTYYWI